MSLSKKTIKVALEALTEDLEGLGVGQAIEGNFTAAADLANAGAELESELERLNAQDEVNEGLARRPEEPCERSEELDKRGD